MKKYHQTILTLLLILSASYSFISCQQEQNDDLTVTLKNTDTAAKQYTYWYKVSGTISFTSRTSSENNYELPITDGNMYISWTEDPNRKSNYKDYSLKVLFEYYYKDSSVKASKELTKSFSGIGNQYDFKTGTTSYTINGDVTGNNFTCNINYPGFYETYNYENYTREYFDAEIKLTCIKV